MLVFGVFVRVDLVGCGWCGWFAGFLVLRFSDFPFDFVGFFSL